MNSGVLEGHSFTREDINNCENIASSMPNLNISIGSNGFANNAGKSKLTMGCGQHSSFSTMQHEKEEVQSIPWTTER